MIPIKFKRSSITCDQIKQLLATHEKYKKDILGRLAGLVLCSYAHTHPDYAPFFGGFHID